MGKKPVPDWLNSPIWSSSPPPPSPNDDGDNNHPLTKFKSAAPSASSYEPPSDDYFVNKDEPPVQVTPPLTVREEIPRVEFRDPLSYSYDNGSTRSNSSEDVYRQSQLAQELSRKVINISIVRRLAAEGIPDGTFIRAQVWKLLLNYLPPDRVLWSSELAKKRSQYKHFKEELLVTPSELTWKLESSLRHEANEEKYESRGLLSRSDVTLGEHPLSLRKTSIWNQFFQDTEMIEQIDRDVKRTHPDIDFFSGPSEFSRSNQESLRNILIIFGKLNPGIRYVQGMNEILAPIFYVFRNDLPEEKTLYARRLSSLNLNFQNDPALSTKHPRSTQKHPVRVLELLEELVQHKPLHSCVGGEEIFSLIEYLIQVSVEADTFFCFSELLSGFRDLFCQQLDNSVVGIRSTIAKLSKLLKEHDEELWRHLEVTTNVNPQFYAFRWITLLLTQEFTFTEILTIWDALLSDPEGPQETLLRICCAMLILVRRRLLAGDFTSNLKLLQHYPTTNISHLLYVANKLRSAH